MSEINIKAEVRTEAQKNSKKLRLEGKIPAVVYGNKINSISLVIDYNIFQKAYSEAGESTIIMLEIDGKKKGVLIKDVQFHPVSDKIIHVDFYEVDMSQKITTAVPLSFFGQSKAVKDEGGTLVVSIDEIEVECLPGDLPKEIRVNIESLATFDNVIKISDLDIPEGVEVLLDKKEVIATVIPPRSEEELKELEEEVKEDIESVEGIEKPEEEMEATESEQAAVEEKKEKTDNDSKGNSKDK